MLRSVYSYHLEKPSPGVEFLLRLERQVVSKSTTQLGKLAFDYYHKLWALKQTGFSHGNVIEIKHFEELGYMNLQEIRRLLTRNIDTRIGYITTERQVLCNKNFNGAT